MKKVGCVQHDCAECKDLSALKLDAARYRWLRDQENGGNYSVGNMTDSCDGGWERVDWQYGSDLDAAIDAAMKEGVK